METSYPRRDYHTIPNSWDLLIVVNFELKISAKVVYELIYFMFEASHKGLNIAGKYPNSYLLVYYRFLHMPS